MRMRVTIGAIAATAAFVLGIAAPAQAGGIVYWSGREGVISTGTTVVTTTYVQQRVVTQTYVAPTYAVPTVVVPAPAVPVYTVPAAVVPTYTVPTYCTVPTYAVPMVVVRRTYRTCGLLGRPYRPLVLRGCPSRPSCGLHHYGHRPTGLTVRFRR